MSLLRGPSVNVPIRRMAHFAYVIPANGKKGGIFGHQMFPSLRRESNSVPLALETSTLTTELHVPAYFPQSQPLVKKYYFGVSPINYSDLDRHC